MYDGSVGHSFRSDPRTRSRSEARRLAEQLRSKALEAPDRFAELAAEYSDAPRSQRGDFGAWHVHDKFAEPHVIRLLLDTKVGELTPIVEDGNLGFRIFKRTAPRERKLYGVRVISVPFEEESERSTARQKAESILSQVATNPALFDSSPDAICATARCIGPFTVVEGRADLPDLDESLERIEIGQVAPQVVEGWRLFAVARRESPGATEPVPAPNFTLPRPESRTTQSASSRELVSYLKYFAGTATRTSGFTKEQEERFVQIMESLVAAIETAPVEERDGLFRNVRAEVASVFGQAKANELDALDRRLQDELLGQLPRRN
jgi:hypothetical protein